MLKKQKLPVGPFSEKEKMALEYIGIDPTEERFGGVLPKEEIVEALFEANQAISQSKYDFFKRVCAAGVITEKELDELAPFFGIMEGRHTPEQLANAHAAAEEAAEKATSHATLFEIDWKLLEREEALVARHNSTLFRLMEPKQSGRRVN